MGFHDVRFPASLSFGSVGGPERRTEIVTLSNGAEERSTPWAHSRRRFDAGMGMRSLDDLAALIGFFEARAGQLHGFRWKDWSDWKSCLPSDRVGPPDQPLGAGDGARTDFQLLKTYRSGGESYARPITKPVAGTVRVAVGGDERAEGVHFTVDALTGVVSFAVAPGLGAPVTAGYEFDVPVRFDTDRIEASVASFSAGEIPSVPVIEVRE
ncbi:DUF2460 domain-containing protein [Halovulum dunhuangense]|uniref:DUF2460 domain-containing protein n=1 Tax=Halovulum dunhuangense TaxID=1505036 RepID=A0A849L6N6_9RHOB|nr:DUF2460 domain-containing protein [Halovulum dunhuangense]NNU81913.1 DUF2460 domain-containing protein [Halovulum dunhuangense]